MPELPEVEVAKRQLKAKLQKKNHPFVVKLATNFKREDGTAYNLRKAVPSLKPLVGQTLTGMTRKGKYILMRFERHILVCHFGMTGMMYVSDKKTIKDLNTKHEIIRLTDGEGRSLSYTDARKFGLIDLVPVKNWEEYKENLNVGFEPLPDEFLESNIKVLLKKYKNRPIKDWLLDQSLIAGIGNIYASEVCFALKLHPMQASSSPVVTRKSKLMKIVVQNILRKAVLNGGSTIRSYETPDGTVGQAQLLHKVYGKEGKPCTVCGTPITAMVIKGRATFFCDSCQKLH